MRLPSRPGRAGLPRRPRDLRAPAELAVPSCWPTATPAGTWAYEARRIAAGVPRIGVDTDHRTIPNELGLLGVAVHLDKGCYRGQETVARVHTLGRPPRRLVRLHLDGTADALPAAGRAADAGRARGRLRRRLRPALRARPDRPRPGQAQRRHRRDADRRRRGEIAAAQEILVDPEIGLHVRARL